MDVWTDSMRDILKNNKMGPVLGTISIYHNATVIQTV